MIDITYCSDNECCPYKNKCLRADISNKKQIYVAKYYEEHVLSWKEDKCQYYIPTIERD
jgi:hypothetical protein